MDFSARSAILVTCSKGLSERLRDEVELLGMAVRDTHDTGVVTTGTVYDCMKLNLNLRTAFNVLWLIKDFKARTPERLYNRAQTIDWETIIPANAYFSVVSRIDTPNVNNSMFASVKVKDAIVDQFADRVGRRPDSGPERDRIVINLYWKDDHVWVYLNTSGRKLSDRGYRLMPHRAPMQETLAAAVIQTTGYDGTQPFISPMCGSGTLAIEAALMATHRAPGTLRDNFGFMHVVGFDRNRWTELREEAFRKVKNLAIRPAPIIATDIDPVAINAARHNARDAGVDRLIDFRVCDFEKTPIPTPGETGGIVIINPEYGKRLGDVSALEKTYERMGDFLKQKCNGYTGWVFTGNMELAKRIGLKASRRIPFWNAEIECRLLKYDLYEGSRRMAASADAQTESEPA